MDKSVNIEVLLKAAEFIEQANKSKKVLIEKNFKKLILIFNNLNQDNVFFEQQQHKQLEQEYVPQSSELDQINKNARIFNNSINNLPRNAIVLDNINKYFNSYAKKNGKNPGINLLFLNRICLNFK
jgi:hypothetical protein